MKTGEGKTLTITLAATQMPTAYTLQLMTILRKEIVKIWKNL